MKKLAYSLIRMSLSQHSKWKKCPPWSCSYGSWIYNYLWISAFRH